MSKNSPFNYNPIPLGSDLYQGAWNASTNTPTLVDGVGVLSSYYIVSVGGTQNLGSGAITFSMGDEAVYNGSAWERIPSFSYVPVNKAGDTMTGTLTVPNLINSGLTASQAVVTNGSKQLASIAYSSSSSASSLVQRDANQNISVNNAFLNFTSVVSAGTTTTLTVASSYYQNLTGSSNQTFQLPDATTMPKAGSPFVFNNNSSGSLIVVNAAASSLYTVPAGGWIQCNLLDNSTANGVWDFHSSAPSTVTWGSGATGLVFNTALTTTPSINAGISSATNPSFIPQRGNSTNGYGGDSTKLYGIIGGAAAFTASSTSFTAPNFISTAGANTVKEYSANSSTAITIDPANGETQYITLNAATPVITFASAPTAGTSKRIKLTLIQDGTGGRLPTFANCTFLATGSSTATAINSAINSLTYFEAEAINGIWVVASANQNLGVTDGSVAPAGYIGEIISSSIAIGSATSLTTATAKSITSITLTPGDWMVSGNIGFIAATGTIPTALTASVSVTNNTQATSPNDGAFAQIQATLGTASTNVLTLASTRINITSTTTYYLVGTATFTVSTLTAYGSISARRFR